MKTKHYDLLKENLEGRTFRNAVVAAREANDLLTAAFSDVSMREAFSDRPVPFSTDAAIDLPLLTRTVQVQFRDGDDIVAVVIDRTIHLSGKLVDKSYPLFRLPASVGEAAVNTCAAQPAPGVYGGPQAPTPAPASEWSDTAFQSAEPAKDCEIRIGIPGHKYMIFHVDAAAVSDLINLANDRK